MKDINNISIDEAIYLCGKYLSRENQDYESVNVDGEEITNLDFSILMNEKIYPAMVKGHLKEIS